MKRDNLLSGISHLLIIGGAYGFIITLIIYLFEKDKSDFLNNNLKQAIGMQALVLSLKILVNIGRVFGLVHPFQNIIFETIKLDIISFMLNIIVIPFAIYASINVFKGRFFKYPIIGEYIHNYKSQN